MPRLIARIPHGRKGFLTRLMLSSITECDPIVALFWHQSWHQFGTNKM